MRLFAWHNDMWRADSKPETLVIGVIADQENRIQSKAVGLGERGKNERPSDTTPMESPINGYWPEKQCIAGAKPDRPVSDCAHNRVIIIHRNLRKFLDVTRIATELVRGF